MPIEVSHVIVTGFQMLQTNKSFENLHSDSDTHRFLISGFRFSMGSDGKNYSAHELSAEGNI